MDNFQENHKNSILFSSNGNFLSQIAILKLTRYNNQIKIPLKLMSLKAGGWYQHEGWLKTSLFVSSQQKTSEGPKAEQSHIVQKIVGTSISVPQVPIQRVVQYSKEVEMTQNQEQGDLCPFEERGVGTFLIKQNYSNLFKNTQTEIKVHIQSILLNFYNKNREIVMALELSNKNIILSRPGKPDEVTQINSEIFPVTDKDAFEMLCKKLWVRMNKLNYSLGVSTGDSANFQSDQLFFKDFSQEPGQSPRNTWETSEAIFDMPSFTVDGKINERKHGADDKLSFTNFLQGITFFSITVGPDGEGQNYSDFLQIKFQNIVRELSPVLDLSPSILDPKSANLALVPHQLDLLYTYLKDLSCVNLPDYNSKESTSQEKQIYLSWRDLQYAIHSSLTTPYHYRKYQTDKIQTPVGILNHLFKMKNKKKYVPFDMDISQKSKGELMNDIYENRQGYVRLELLPHQGLGPGSMAVLEVWPPYCCSPVHNHGDAFGLIKVLAGTIRVENYSDLNFKSLDKADPYQQMDYSQNQYTWLSQQSFGIHRLVNLNDQTCLSLQAYYHDQSSVQYFSFIEQSQPDHKQYIEYFPQNDWKNYLLCVGPLAEKIQKNSQRKKQLQNLKDQLTEEQKIELAGYNEDQFDLNFIEKVIEVNNLRNGGVINHQFYKLALVMKEQYSYARNYPPKKERNKYETKDYETNGRCVIYQIGDEIYKKTADLPTIHQKNIELVHVDRKNFQSLLSTPNQWQNSSLNRYVFIYSKKIFADQKSNTDFALSFFTQMNAKYSLPPSLKIVYEQGSDNEIVSKAADLYVVGKKEDLGRLVSQYLEPKQQ